MGLNERFVYFYEVRQIFGISLWAEKKKNKTQRFRYVRGGKQTLVYPRTVHSSTVVANLNPNESRSPNNCFITCDSDVFHLQVAPRETKNW